MMVLFVRYWITHSVAALDEASRRFYEDAAGDAVVERLEVSTSYSYKTASMDVEKEKNEQS